MTDARPSPDVISEREMCRRLVNAISSFGGVRPFARKYGLSPSTVCQIANNSIEMTPAVAAALGYQREVVFRPRSQGIMQ